MTVHVKLNEGTVIAKETDTRRQFKWLSWNNCTFQIFILQWGCGGAGWARWARVRGGRTGATP